MRAFAPITLALLLLSGCGPADDATKQAEATGLVTAASDATPCPILPASRISALYGATLTDAPGNALPQAQSCEFKDSSGDSRVYLNVVPANYYEEHEGKDFRKLPGIGEDASIVWELDGWRATSKEGTNAVVVMTDGTLATQDKTIAMLTEALAALK